MGCAALLAAPPRQFPREAFQRGTNNACELISVGAQCESRVVHLGSVGPTYPRGAYVRIHCMHNPTMANTLGKLPILICVHTRVFRKRMRNTQLPLGVGAV